MKNTTIKICNETIHPGETINMAMPLPQLYTCAPLYMPIKVVHGRNAGPTLLVIAAMHGNELNGTQIINRLLSLPLLKKLSGTLVAIPVLNVQGLMNRSSTLPGGVNLDTCFPGADNGSNAARLAHLFNTAIFSNADYCIDLQTGPLNYSNLPQLFINVKDGKAKHLAKAFNAPVVIGTTASEGSLCQLAEEKNISYIRYEAGEAMRFDEETIKVGLQGIVNVMRHLEMLPEKQHKSGKAFKSYFTDKYIWIHSEASGVSDSKIQLGKHIKKGDIISVIKDPFGVSTDVVVRSPYEGIIIGRNNMPLVQEGEGIFQLAVFAEMQSIESHLIEWNNINAAENQQTNSAGI